MKNIVLKPVGVVADIPPPDLPPDVWSQVVNIAFEDDAANLADNYRQLDGATIKAPSIIIPNQKPSEFYYVYGGSDGIGVSNGQQHFDITPASFVGAGAGEWTGCELNNLVLLNNGANVPLYWPGSTGSVCLPLPGWPSGSLAGWVRSFKYMAIAGDIQSANGDFENQVLWSNSVDPGAVPDTWTPAPDNTAGDNVLAATPGSIVDGIALRDSFYLMKSHSIYSMQLVGGRYLFNFRKLFVTVGALTKNCAAEFKGFLYIFADGDIVRTDGQAIESIAERTIKTTLFSELDTENYKKCFVATWAAKNQLWFCYPTTGNTVPNKAAVYNLVTGRWGFRDLPSVSFATRGLINDAPFAITWATQTDTWETISRIWAKSATSAIADSLIFSVENIDSEPGKLYAVGEVDSNSPLITGQCIKLSMPLEHAELVKYVNEIWPRVKAAPGTEFKIRVGGQRSEYDPITWSPEQIFVSGQDDKINVNVTGRFISVEITTASSVNDDRRIVGFDLRYKLQGRY